MRALIEDSNNKLGQHATKNEWWEAHGFQVVRCRLPVGDYVFMPPIVVDTKRDVPELAMDIDVDHERFKRAAIKARDMGTKLVILVENEEGITDLESLTKWVNPRNAINRSKGLRPPINGQRLAKACATMQTRYGMRFEFCAPEDAAKRVVEILNEEEGGGRDGDGGRGA